MVIIKNQIVDHPKSGLEVFKNRIQRTEQSNITSVPLVLKDVRSRYFFQPDPLFIHGLETMRVVRILALLHGFPH